MRIFEGIQAVLAGMREALETRGPSSVDRATSAGSSFATWPYARAFKRAATVSLDLDSFQSSKVSALARASEDVYLCLTACTLLDEDDRSVRPEWARQFHLPAAAGRTTTHALAAAWIQHSVRSITGNLAAIQQELGTQTDAGHTGVVLEYGGLVGNLTRLLNHPRFSEVRRYEPLSTALSRLRDLTAGVSERPLQLLEQAKVQEQDFGLAAAIARLQDAEDRLRGVAGGDSTNIPASQRAKEYALLAALARPENRSGVIEAIIDLIDGDEHAKQRFANVACRREDLSDHPLDRRMALHALDGGLELSESFRSLYTRLQEGRPPAGTDLGPDPQAWIDAGRARMDPGLLRQLESAARRAAPLHFQMLDINERVSRGDASALAELDRTSKALEQVLSDVLTPQLQHGVWAALDSLCARSRFSLSEARALAASIHSSAATDQEILPNIIRDAHAWSIQFWDGNFIGRLRATDTDLDPRRTGENATGGTAIHLRKNLAPAVAAGSIRHEDAHLGEDASVEGFREAMRTLQQRKAAPGEITKLARVAGPLLSFRIRSVELKGRYFEPYMGTRYVLGGTEMTSTLCGEFAERRSAARAAILDLETFLLVFGGAAVRNGTSDHRRSIKGG